MRKPHKHTAPPWSLSDGGAGMCCLLLNEHHPVGELNSAPGGAFSSLVNGYTTKIQGLCHQELERALST